MLNQGIINRIKILLFHESKPDDHISFSPYIQRCVAGIFQEILSFFKGGSNCETDRDQYISGWVVLFTVYDIWPTAIGITCARARYSTYFVSFETLIIQLKKAHLENRLESRMKFFARYKVLIIDEIGYMPIDPDATALFFQLIAKRYEKHCTIITSNTPFSRWGEIFGSPTLANAVLDCLLHHSQIISIKGPSYRLKEKRAFMEERAEE